MSRRGVRGGEGGGVSRIGVRGGEGGGLKGER